MKKKKDHKRGMVLYVPADTLTELEKLRSKDGYGEQSLAFKELTRYAKIGKELERQFNPLGLKRRKKWR